MVEPWNQRGHGPWHRKVDVLALSPQQSLDQGNTHKTSTQKRISEEGAGALRTDVETFHASRFPWPITWRQRHEGRFDICFQESESNLLLHLYTTAGVFRLKQLYTYLVSSKSFAAHHRRMHPCGCWSEPRWRKSCRVGAFIVGFDHDNQEVFQALIDFTLENNILGQYHILIPFPGTRIRDHLVREGKLNANDSRWERYGCFDVVFTPKMISKEQLEAGLLEAYQTVYSKEAHLKRSRHMIDILKHLRKT